MIPINCLILLALLALPIQSKTKCNAAMYNDVVTVNGQPLTVEALSLYSRGVLAVVDGDPRPSKHKPIRFRVLLRRDGKAIHTWPAHSTEGAYSLQLNEIWSFAQFCDELVVEPISSPAPLTAYNRHKRVIKVVNINWINWFVRGNC